MEANSPAQVSTKAKLLLVFFGVLLSALGLEGAVRLISSPPSSKKQRPAWSDRPYAFFMPADAGTLQDSNRHPKAPGAFRIAVVGDSFTFGPHLQLKDTFPKQLELMLNLNPEAPRVEVLNRGVSGASTETETEFVRRALREDLELLVLEITLNDAEPHLLTPEERRELFEAPWLESPFFKLWRTAGLVAQRIHNSLTVSRYIDYHTKFYKEPESYKRFSAAIRVIAQDAKNAGVPIIAIVFPFFDFPINDRYPFKESHEIIGRTLKEAGIAGFDLLPVYRGIPPERLQVIPGADSHPNEIAHRMAAERLLAILSHQKLVPETSVPTRVSRERDALRTNSGDFKKNMGQGFRPFASHEAPAATREDIR